MTTDEQALTQVREAVERFVGGRTDVDAEDVVQEAMTRLLENRARLEPGAWASYAVVSAGNLLRDRGRARAMQRRHEHRLHAPDLAASAEEQVLTAEEHEALRRALTSLQAPEAELLSEHYGTRGASNRSIAPYRAARLARARAKLRVAYLLQHARVPLPTVRCRPVLEALSSGDRRRQERLGAGRHLVSCRACASYAPALVERRRALAAVHPLGWLAFLAGAGWAALRRHPGRTATVSGTAVVLAAAVGGAAVLQSPPAGTAPAAGVPLTAVAASSLLVEGQPVLPRRSGMPAPIGSATATGVVVQDVPADEGFWVGSGPGQRWWLQVIGDGESPVAVRAGDKVSFSGRAVPTVPGFASAVGLTVEEGGRELEELGVYLTVLRADLVLVS